jgi:hypothetical protein
MIEKTVEIKELRECACNFCGEQRWCARVHNLFICGYCAREILGKLDMHEVSQP